MKVPPELDRITDKVLAYNPDAPPRGEPLKVIAGAPDRPLVIEGVQIPCFVLEDETRVLVQRGVATGLGMSRPSGVQLHRFLLSKSIKPFVSSDLIEVLNNPIKFWTPNGIGHGYPATILVEICRVVLAARDAGALRASQIHIARQCDTLIRGLATVGIIALVDEATGYQEVRDRLALHKFLDRYLKAEQAKWAKRFPDDFYQQIFRLRDWRWKGMKINRPSVVGHYTNDIVWDRLAPHIHDELRKRNPKSSSGHRPAKHHQWLTDDIGHPALQNHLSGVMAVMRLSSSWRVFNKNLDIAYPKQNVNREMPFAAE